MRYWHTSQIKGVYNKADDHNTSARQTTASDPYRSYSLEVQNKRNSRNAIHTNSEPKHPYVASQRIRATRWWKTWARLEEKEYQLSKKYEANRYQLPNMLAKFRFTWIEHLEQVKLAKQRLEKTSENT